MPVVKYLGDKKFICGDNLTYVDFIIFEMIDFCQWLSDGKLGTSYPTLLPYFDRIKNLPRLKDYWPNDSKCIKRPFNNKIAKLNN